MLASSVKGGDSVQETEDLPVISIDEFPRLSVRVASQFELFL
jgi:hypothetical protein